MDKLNGLEKQMLMNTYQAKLNAEKIVSNKRQKYNTLCEVRNAIRLYRWFHIKTDEKIINHLLDNDVMLEVYVNKRACPSRKVISNSYNKDELIASFDKKIEEALEERKKAYKTNNLFRDLIVNMLCEFDLSWNELEQMYNILTELNIDCNQFGEDGKIKLK